LKATVEAVVQLAAFQRRKVLEAAVKRLPGEEAVPPRRLLAQEAAGSLRKHRPEDSAALAESGADVELNPPADCPTAALSLVRKIDLEDPELSGAISLMILIRKL